MTTVLARTVAPATYGRYPALVIAGKVSRQAGRSGAVWGLVFGGYVLVQTFGYTSAYRTQAARDQLAHAFGSNIGINALIGPARSIDTVAGYASWRALGVLSLLGAVWGLLTSTRLLRGEEEAGRAELLQAGQTSRRGACAQTLGGLGVGLLALFALTAAGTVVTGRAKSADFSVGGSIYFSLTLVSAAAMFMAIGALTSQFAATRQRAAAIAGVALGVSFALRMVADATTGLHWLVWLGPLGWIEETRPLTDPRPVALVPIVVLFVVVTGTAWRSAGSRDLGAALAGDRQTGQAHLSLLRGPATLTLRLIRPVALGWLFAVGVFAVLIGTVAEAATKAITGSTAIEKVLDRLGGHGSLVRSYLGLTFLVLATMTALIAAGQLTAMRSEEADGHLDVLLARAVSRTSWYAGRLAAAAGVVALAGVLAGLGTWVGAESQHSDVGFGVLMLAGLNVVAPSLFVVGLGAFTIGGRPRATSIVVYAFLSWSFLLEFVGSGVHASHWLMDTSIFFHMVPAPAAPPDWTSTAVIAGLAVAGAIGGGFLLRRRDTLGA